MLLVILCDVRVDSSLCTPVAGSLLGADLSRASKSSSLQVALAHRSLHLRSSGLCWQRSLQRCCLPRLVERYGVSELPDEHMHVLTSDIPWSELKSDHVNSDGQVFRCDDSNLEKS